MRSGSRLAASLVALIVTACAVAEGWTVQTVAVRDLRMARTIATDLNRLGFDAYTEFAMAESGLQWVRVRVGCFVDRDDAEKMATLLRSGMTREAVAVERTAGAPTVGCVEREIGFVTPDVWHQRAPGVAAFEVEVAGVAGLVRYQNGRWQVLQAPATEALADRLQAGDTFSEVDGPTGPFVQIRSGEGERFLCAGTLLAEAEGAAIVELDGTVSACRLSLPAVGGSP